MKDPKVYERSCCLLERFRSQFTIKARTGAISLANAPTIMRIPRFIQPCIICTRHPPLQHTGCAEKCAMRSIGFESGNSFTQFHSTPLFVHSITITTPTSHVTNIHIGTRQIGTPADFYLYPPELFKKKGFMEMSPQPFDSHAPQWHKNC